MTDKLELYDVLSVLVPGTLLVGLVPICFRSLLHIHGASFPAAFAVLLLTGLAIFLGFIQQALGSLIEPFLEKTWGGRPSKRVFAGGLGNRYLGKEEADRIKPKLIKAVGEGQSDAGLFRYASQMSDAAEIGRCTRFNGLYAYHRSLLSTCIASTVLFLASAVWGSAAALSLSQKGLVLLGALVLSLLMWHRTRQRSLYFAAEVLMTAERVLDEKASAYQAPAGDMAAGESPSAQDATAKSLKQS